MKFRKFALMVGVSALALSSAARAAQSASSTTPEIEEVVVTGSRVATNGDSQPTPVTVLPIENLLTAEPANIARALRQLPQFDQSQPERGSAPGSSNGVGAYLNLRQFGPQRVLILLDGVRVPPSSSDGSVDVNIIPQSLVQRVDIVTGGASAVYGSDAVTGVVNFVLDHTYTGVKAEAQSGISSRGDALSYRGGITVGTPVGTNGHFVAAYDHYHSDKLGARGRPEWGGNPNFWTRGGDGTAGNPFRLVQYGHMQAYGAPGGAILDATGPLANIVFKSNGVPSTFIHGASTGIAGIEAGGDGSVYEGSILSALTTHQLLARYTHDFGNDVSGFVQGSWNQSSSDLTRTPMFLFNRTILSGNAFLPASIQQIMTANNIPSFRIARINDISAGYPSMDVLALSRSAFAVAGLEGSVFEDWKWKFDYTYSRSTQRVTALNNPSAEKYAAALDAVINPATGKVVCQISLTPYASRFPGCEPINVFGPTAATYSSMDFITDDTRYTLANAMHNVRFSVAGSPFSTWAAPVVVALNGEYRWQSLSNVSNAESGSAINCDGLRANCVAGQARWESGTTASMSASSNVKEAGAEAQVPLMRGKAFAESLEMNVGGRFTDYSTSGSVYTWKVGAVWDVTDEFRIRGTRSRDIRAPTLTDLFRPATVIPSSLNDLHTGINRSGFVYIQGNPNLKPEVANTTAVGINFRPNWVPGFSVTLDYYKINMANAIVSVRGNDDGVQRECENSNGTSPLCSLLVRPLPFSDRTAANYPTRILGQSVNAAKQWTEGWDFETNYRFNLADVVSAANGSIDARVLGTYQPLLKTQTLPGLLTSQAAGVATNSDATPGFSKVRLNVALTYSLDNFSGTVSYRWKSSQQPTDRHYYVDLRPDIPAYSYTDISLRYKVEVGGSEVEPFLTVQNLFDKAPPIVPTGGLGVGLAFPSPAGYDVKGRYFTFGLRGSF